MSHLDILIPFALPPAELSADLLRELNAPALAMLTARAASRGAAERHETVEGFSRALPHETWLARHFGLDERMRQTGSPPVALALMQALGLSARPGTWFVLQPVHIHIARDHLVLTDPRQLSLTEQDSRVLFEIAKPLFDEHGKQLLYANANTWFMQADEWSELQTSTPDAATGHNIDIWMPTGRGERDWRKLQNEVQMHWYGHQLNDERESKGLRPVNSLWLWGASDESVQGTGSNNYSHVVNLSDWMRAFMQFVPQHANFAHARDLIENKPRHALMVLDSLLVPALLNDWGRWLENMQQLETNWFGPLLAALRSGSMDRVSLILTRDAGMSRYDISKASLRKFWVKPTLNTLSA